MTPEYRKRAFLALLTAAVGGGLIAYGWGRKSSEDTSAPASSLSPRSLTSYVAQQAEDEGTGLYGMEPLKAQDGALSWDLFAAVQNTTQEEPSSAGVFPNAFRIILKPMFTEAIKHYDGKKVKIMGYMFPLEDGASQRHFLMGPYPPTCVLHYHAPNNQVIEVTSDTPIPLMWEPILVEGTLMLLPDDPKNSFYRLEKTRFIKEYPFKAN
jgi:hypothetical protein